MPLTAKSNLLRAIHRNCPQWVPNAKESVVRTHAPVVERPAAAGLGAFGVYWSYKEGAEEVRAEVRERIDEMALGGGYIAAPSHGVPYDPAPIEAMNDEIETYGRQAYASLPDRN
jgi:hypothetical protein